MAQESPRKCQAHKREARKSSRRASAHTTFDLPGKRSSFPPETFRTNFARRIIPCSASILNFGRAIFSTERKNRFHERVKASHFFLCVVFKISSGILNR